MFGVQQCAKQMQASFSFTSAVLKDNFINSFGKFSDLQLTFKSNKDNYDNVLKLFGFEN